MLSLLTISSFGFVFKIQFHFQALHPAHCLNQGGGRAAGVHRAVHPSKVVQVHPLEADEVHLLEVEPVHLPKVVQVHPTKVETDEVHPPEVLRGRKK